MNVILLPPNAELKQCGNGKAAISAGNHSSQRSASAAAPIDDGSKPVNEADLPAKTVYNDVNGTDYYKSKVYGNYVDFYVQTNPSVPDADREVAFSVNGSDVRTQGIDKETSTALALKAREIMRFDAKRRPNGFVYAAQASTGDGAGADRARLYSMAGFSRPEKAGDWQYAIVMNGKLKPYKPAM